MTTPFYGPAPIRQPIRIPVTFTILGVPTDPTTVIFTWDMPMSNPITAKTTTTLTVIGNVNIGGPPNIVKPSYSSTSSTVYTVDTVTDSGATWSVNQWEGLRVATSDGNLATVLNNTVTMLRVKPEWDPVIVPVAGTTFEIGGPGFFYVDVTPPAGPGPLRWRFEGTGAVQAVVEGSIDVTASPLA